jgi:hypothetical protein
MAESSGVNTKAIELKQQDKITNRQKKQTERIEELAKKIKKLNKPIPSDPAT